MKYFIVYLTKSTRTDTKHIRNSEIEYNKEISSIEDIKNIEEKLGDFYHKVTLLNYKKLFDE